MWHLQLITGLVILISLSRYLLLKTWIDFGESSKAANHQVLTSLQPLDYMVVAFLPGVSEGNICWVCLWLCDNCILENHCANGFTCSKQSVWRDRTEVHLKVVKID